LQRSLDTQSVIEGWLILDFPMLTAWYGFRLWRVTSFIKAAGFTKGDPGSLDSA